MEGMSVYFRVVEDLPGSPCPIYVAGRALRGLGYLVDGAGPSAGTEAWSVVSGVANDWAGAATKSNVDLCQSAEACVGYRSIRRHRSRCAVKRPGYSARG
jgi:hypothetical protein